MSKAKLPRKNRTAARSRRSRRSTQEITDLIIEAACNEFERNGYDKTKTAAIARRAGVAETLIFSNFGSKPRLFHDSIFMPLDKLFVQFCATHFVDASDAEGMKQGTLEYIFEFQEFIKLHSRMLKTLVSAQLFESGNVKGLSQVEGLHHYFDRASARMRSRPAGKPRLDPALLTRISFATILACILFNDWLFPKGLAGKQRITAAISAFVAEGLNANAPSTSTKRRSGKSPSVLGRTKSDRKR